MISVLSHLNPFNRLFGRIFLWFWLATILMVVSSIWIARQVINDEQIRPVNQRQASQLQRISMQLSGEISNEASMRRKARALSMRHRTLILLFNTQTQQWLYEGRMPPDVIKHLSPPAELLQQPAAVAMRHNRLEFVGPQTIELGPQSYLLFTAHPIPPGFVRDFYQNNPALMIVLMIVISGLLCFLLAWSISKPLRRLQQATQQMAAGKLSTRVDDLQQRRDEIGQLGQDFNRMSSHLEQLLEGHKRLLSDISHELRTPLARLQLAIGIAQEKGQQDDELLARIEKEAQRMEQMIAQVLTLSRLDSQLSSLDLQPIELNLLVDELVADGQYEAQAMKKQVILQRNQPCSIVADRTLLSSALENCLRNAIKYADTQVTVSLTFSGNTIECLICDDGPGIADEVIANIFTPFYRVANSRSRDTGGVGLGLAIAKRAVEAHNGTITANNCQPHGLQLKLTFPCQ